LGPDEGVSTGRCETREGPARVLLVGYNGANNTGSESRLLSIIEDVRAVLGPEAVITIPTLNAANLCRYIEESPTLRVAPIPSIYFSALKRLVLANDMMLLVEGSCYMDTWTSALLWAFLWSTKQAAEHGRPSMAYAVDSGNLSSGNLKRVRRDASRTDLIVTRTEAAASRLRSYGVTAPMEVTADTTFTFRMANGDDGILRRTWPDARAGVVGVAPVDFYRWPVVVRPFGRSSDCYRWPYYYSRSRARSEATRRLAEGLAREVERIVLEHDRDVALIAMESLDDPMVHRVRGMVSCPDRVRVYSACDYNASQMMGLLRSLDGLVSSRYHSCVMASFGSVPMVAIGHDLRVEDLFRDMNIYKSSFIHHLDEDLFAKLKERVDVILSDPAEERAAVGRAHGEHVSRASRNRELFRSFMETRGWKAAT
jgi:polysaccharide pyruvyl transferase WcaK-like protein